MAGFCARGRQGVCQRLARRVYTRLTTKGTTQATPSSISFPGLTPSISFAGRAHLPFRGISEKEDKPDAGEHHLYPVRHQRVEDVDGRAIHARQGGTVFWRNLEGTGGEGEEEEEEEEEERQNRKIENKERVKHACLYASKVHRACRRWRGVGVQDAPRKVPRRRDSGQQAVSIRRARSIQSR